jgi:ABC-type multidrug transport system fused ATPase/permease subunit
VRLLRDLWATSRTRTAVVACFVLLDAGGQVVAAALAGSVLVQHSSASFVALASALVIAAVSDVAISLIMAGLSADWAADVRCRLCEVALRQDLPTLDATPVGELLDRIDGDVYQVASELRGAGIRIAQALVMAFLSIIAALVVWWPVGVGMLLVVTVLGVALNRPTQRIGLARVAEEEAWSDLAAVMEESLHGQDDVRTSLARPYVLRLYAQRASQVLLRGRTVWARSARVTAIASGVIRIGIATVVVGGAWALTADRIDPTRLTAGWLLILAFGGTVGQVSRIMPELQYALGAWTRVQLLAAAPQEPTGGKLAADGDLAICGLTFRYPVDQSTGERPPALRDVRLTFARGRSYALIGRSGSGKSTLTKVLTRAVDVPRGAVFLAGADLLDLDIEALRRWVAVVPQRTEMLAGTLAENIALFDPDLLQATAGALAELGLTSWVADLPDGLQTRLGEGGYVLSSGQEQLVAFARILVRDPHVVILDEATARMDPVTEATVQRAAERLLRGRIGIIVAHRLSSVRRCDEVVELADGEVVEAGPLHESERFASLLASSRVPVPSTAVSMNRSTISTGSAGSVDVEMAAPGGLALAAARPQRVEASQPIAPTASSKVDPPPLPDPDSARTLREIFRLATNDARFGLGAVSLFFYMVLLGLDGSVLPWLWAELVDGSGGVFWPAAGIVVGLLLTVPMPYYTGLWFPEWWTRQLLRISLRLVHGQTASRRISAHTPAEVVAQGGDTERVVQLADNLIDQFICLLVLVSMTLVSRTVVPASFFAATMVISGATATAFGPLLERSARMTVAARAAFATALVSSLSAARTVKLAGATRPVLAHLARLDGVRSDRQRREIAIQVWARSTPFLVAGLLPIAAWALYLSGGLTSGATLVAVSTLGAARWFAWTTASLISQLPSARVWTRRTVAMCGVGAYSAPVPGVDLLAGTAPAPATASRNRLRRLDLTGFSAVHEDGTVGVHNVDLRVERGQLVLIVGPVGSGKSSLLRALAGIVHHTGTLSWNGQPVTEPEWFLRPNQVGYVGQQPRVFSGTIADNIQLGHALDPTAAVSTAQLDHDLAATSVGLGLLIGHKGTRLSGGQLQRLALARALAPHTELLIADDVSSALDVTTELALWRALREREVTVVGSTSKEAALTRADLVLVLIAGEAMAVGPWHDLANQWGHLAG